MNIFETIHFETFRNVMMSNVGEKNLINLLKVSSRKANEGEEEEEVI